MNKRSSRPPFLVLAVWLVSTAFMVTAETYYVGVDGSGFSPAALAINVGDTVVWFNDDDTFSHTTTSDLSVTDADYWSAYLFDYLDVYSKTFNNVGTFTYRDLVDVGTGSIVVGGTINQSPEVAITYPSSAVDLTAPATFTIQASAQDPDGNGIAAVEFFVDGTSLGLSYAEPYTATVTDLAAGDHTLSVIGADGLGAQTTHSVTITVKPAEIVLRDPRMTGGFFLFDVTGLNEGKPSVLLASADLSQWNPILTNTAENTSMTFTNAISPGYRFYRVIQLP